MSDNRISALLKYKEAKLSDFDDFFLLQSDEKIMHWSGFSEKPVPDKLLEWYKQKLDGGERTILLFYFNENKTPVGFFYIDDKEKYSSEIEVAYGVNSDFQGRGMGTEMMKQTIQFIIKIFSEKKIINAWILDDNIPSIKMVKKNNFVPADEFRNADWLGQVRRLQKFYLKLNEEK